MEPFLEDLQDSIAATDVQVASGADSDDCDGMFAIRKRVAIFRRYVMPRKLVLERLHERSIRCRCFEDQQRLGEYRRDGSISGKKTGILAKACIGPFDSLRYRYLDK